ncbi:MAG: hypothetical protein V1774_02625 [Candidatus Eisenbacteria bacterium]
MHRAAFILVLALVLVAQAAHGRPSFTIGSDPYETVFAYPHDILQWPSRTFYLSYTPQTAPWQGDVTHPQNRPSASYTSNYQEVEFAPPHGYEGDPAAVHSWVHMSSYLHQHNYTAGGLAETRYGRFLIELGATAIDMDLAAQGVARSEPSADNYVLIPFQSATEAQRDDYSFKVIHARQFLGNPLGAKVEYTRKTAGRPEGYLNFNREGTDYQVPHLTWGWATQSCNHIFGYGNINVDAFYQNSYTVFEGRQWDMQLSYEHAGNWKSGLRYRTGRQDGDSYAWSYDEGSEFVGDYEVDPHWKNRESTKLLRAYTKASFLRRGDLDGGMLFLLQYDSDADTRVNKQVETESDSREGRSGYALEANPYFNFRMPQGFVDFGLLLEVGRSGMRNSETRWNPASHSEQDDVLWSTEPLLGWSEYWENFSQGREWFFATGVEANTSVAVYRGLSALLRVTILRKDTHTKKLYGNSEIPAGGYSYEFYQTHRRDNFRRETWMTGMVGFSCQVGPAKLYLTQDLPTSYLLAQSTKLADNDELLFDHEQRQMWQVQQPSGSRIFVVYALRP